MTQRSSFSTLLVSLATIGALCAGCAAPSNRRAPITPDDNTQPEAGQRAEGEFDPDRSAAPPRAQGRDVTFFGEKPEIAELPFENRLLANYRQHTYSTDGLDFDPAISLDGKTLVFATTRNADRPDICMKTIDGTAITQLTADPADDIQPRFSPDGTHIAYASNRSGNWDIWVTDVGGTRLIQLTDDPSDEIAPSWSADGQTIAFSLWGRKSYRWEIWTVSVGNPGVRRFLAYGMFADWSPEGNRIAFQRARQRGSRWFSVWVADIVDGEARLPREIAHSEAYACITPRWSASGESIVFCGLRSGLDGDPRGRRVEQRSDIWIVNADGGQRTKLTDGAAAAFNPIWGPNGRIFFVSTQSGTENVWSLRPGLEPVPAAKNVGIQAEARATSIGRSVSTGGN